jgi:protein-lysine N-methyltransferase EEF2KMT
MAPQLSVHAQQQLDLFCRQYLQLQTSLSYPDDAFLRQANFQEAIYSKLFQEDALKHAPPHRYQLRVLKELTKRIEESITDWDEEVGPISTLS